VYLRALGELCLPLFLDDYRKTAVNALIGVCSFFVCSSILENSDRSDAKKNFCSTNKKRKEE